jgi:hypothetical protein
MDGTRSSGAEDILEVEFLLLCVIRHLCYIVENQATLAQAFSPPPRPQSIQLNTADIETGTSSSTTQGDEKSSSVDTFQEEALPSSSSDDSWKAEYEAQVQTWRAQSSEAREKAEHERKRWEEVRALEREEAARRNAEVPAVVGKEEHEAGWETVSNSRKTVVSGLHSPSPVDSRDLMTGESERQVRKSAFVHRLR